MMGLAYLTPMTVFDTFGIVSGLTDGHVPTSYLLALAGVLFTAISYGKLVRQFPTAGSAYTYAQKAINPHVGFLVGWSSLLDYLFLPMINTLLAKIYLTALFPEVPPWVWVVGFVILITAINLKSVNLVANFNTLFVLAQVAIILVFIYLVVRGLHNGEGWARCGACGRSSARMRTCCRHYRRHYPVLLVPRLRCGHHAVRRDARRRQGDPARHLPDRAVRRGDLYQRVVLYSAVFPSIQRFHQPDAALPGSRCT